jgi:hypothetical protein
MTIETSQPFNVNSAALLLALGALSGSAMAASSAAPIGLEIGGASCDTARAKLGRSDESKLDGSDILLSALDPNTLYDGASKAIVRCSDGKVIAIQIEASKGGMASEGSRDVYANLSKKYRLVAGGPMPQLGNGYARFTAGNSIIEQDSPHLSFEFTVTYYEKSFYDSIVASKKAKEKKSAEKKQSSL